jgi:hypothetical protein
MIKHSDNIDRDLLSQILDLLIPAGPARGIPGAGAIGVADFVIKAAAFCPDGSAHLVAFLHSVKAAPRPLEESLLRSLEQAQAADFQWLLRQTYMGYYSRPDMRASVGVAPWPVHPKGYDVAAEPQETLDALTAPVRARGPIYRNPVCGTKVTT